MSETGGGEGDGQMEFIAAAGKAAVALGEGGGDKSKLGNEFKNVLDATDGIKIMDYAAGTRAMRSIAEQAEEIRAKGGQP